jgi:proton-translocating NADH-quinone oxidoreductase chain L
VHVHHRVSALIHLYSIGYMKGDRDYPKFFIYLNLFVFSMLVLVLANNLLLTFVGWEGVGVCSYWLVSFWFHRDSAASAGKKAFIYNRIGDAGFLLAIFLIFEKTGTLSTRAARAGGSSASCTTSGGGTATAAVLLLFLAATGKSAQIPLFNWLPDAMEGPTPVSALIHAATMVTAGVYLLCRMNPLLAALSHDGPEVIAIVGGVTAFVAATIACAQQDIKKVLAFSTVSQIGYMILAVGDGAYVAAIFLMVAHAFFKGLLFLGPGSVIHGLDDEQDLKRMGALRKLHEVDHGHLHRRLAGHRRHPAAGRASGPRATCWTTSTPTTSRCGSSAAHRRPHGVLHDGLPGTDLGIRARRRRFEHRGAVGAGRSRRGGGGLRTARRLLHLEEHHRIVEIRVVVLRARLALG